MPSSLAAIACEGMIIVLLSTIFGRSRASNHNACKMPGRMSTPRGSAADERLNARRTRPFGKSPPWCQGNLGPHTVPSAFLRQVALPRADGDQIQVRLLLAERQADVTKYGCGPSAETAVIRDHHHP